MDLTILTKKTMSRSIQAELATYPKLNLFVLYDVHRLFGSWTSSILGIKREILQGTLLPRNVCDLIFGTLICTSTFSCMFLSLENSLNFYLLEALFVKNEMQVK